MSIVLPNNCCELARQMVSFDSVVPYHSGRADAERPLAEYLAQLAQAWGFCTRWLPIEGAASNLLVEYEVSPSAPWLLFDSHLDTVGVEGMTIPPFEPQVRDGRLYGRGACDTKGTGAAMLCALQAYARGEQQPNNVALLFSVGEEHVQLGAREFVAHQLEQLPWRPSGLLVGEPTGMDVLAATGGFIRWKIVTHGAAAHSSRPERGHNAIYDMARVVQAIEQEYLPEINASHSLVGRASAAITVIRGGQQVNVIPPRCEVTFDRRLVPGEAAEPERERVEQLLARVADATPGMQLTHEGQESAPPMEAVDGGQFAERCRQVLDAAGIRSTIRGELFTTNGNHFAAAGLPTVVVGPGDIAQAHTPDEWIAVEQLERGVQGYLVLMQRV